MKRKGFLSLLLCLTLVMGLPPAPALAVSVPWDGTAFDLSWYADPAASSFSISDGADLAGLAKLVNDGTATFAGKTITMTDDIDLGGKLTPPSNWTPIGDENRHFLGNFDGAGHQVRNLYCSWTAPVNWPQVGLFGHLGNEQGNKATVGNLGIVDCAVSVSAGGPGHTGGLVGYALYADISKCYVTGSVTSGSYAGGLVGGHVDGLISDCYSTATVDGYEAGGLVGMGGLLRDSFFYGNMIARFSTGGLVGFNPHSLASCVYLTDETHNPGIPAIGDIADGWPYTAANVFAVPAQGFASEEVALLLNTTYMTTPNSGVWSMGADMPIFAGGSYRPIYIVDLAYSNGDTKYTCSRADGSILLPADPTDLVDAKTFLGWYTDAPYQTAFNPATTFPLTADHALTIYGNFGVRRVTLGNYSAPFSSSPVEYGGAVSDNANGIAGATQLTYTYYTDSQGLNRTTTADGASGDGAAPANSGTYYVQATGTATATIDAVESNLAAMAITSSQDGSTLSISTGTLPTATVGGAYSQALVCVYSGTGTLTYSASGLPSGLVIDAATGIISGTPAAGADAGSPHSVTVGVTDGAVSTSKTFSLAVQPATAGAFVVSGAPGTQYTYANNTLALAQSGTYQISMRTGVASTTTDRIVVASGTTANLTLNGVSIDLSATDDACAFSMAGATVNLTLANGTTSTVKSGSNNAGLLCPAGAALTISGSGTLSVSGGDYGAGIGGARGLADGGTITIGGGTVIATGGSNCAGIGGGEEGSGGVITISAGTVTAQGNYGAGIGGGYGGNAKGGDGGRISITGGTVNATSTGDWSAGIGGGCSSSGGEITISGGLVTAGGGEYGPGIGSGSGASTYGTIRILGGAVIANGGHYGAGIGSGQDCGDGTVEIADGTVNATGGGYAQGYAPGAGAGIGGGNGSNGGTVQITGGTVTAVGGNASSGAMPDGGAGIGGGRFGDGGAVYIAGGSVKAIGGGGEAEVIGKGSDAAVSGTIQNNSTDGTSVYLTTVALANSSGSPISAADIATLTMTWNSGGYLYRTTGMRTDADGRLYVYLPDGSRTTAARAGGADYLGDIATTSAGGSGTLTVSTPVGGGGWTTPAYQATVSGIGGAGTALPVSLDANSGRATLDLGTMSGSQIFGGGAAIITVPPVPGANAYTLEMSATALSGSQGEGTLSFRTSVGSVTLPADMLAGTPGTEGKTFGITVGQGDAAALPDAVRAAVGNHPLIQLTCTLDGVQTPWNNPDAPVTVSVPYTPTDAELAHPEHIVVWYIDGSGNAVAVPNGRYDPATGMVTFTVTHFSQYAVAYVEKTFGDLASVEWARESVEALASKGIISGTGENTYSPAARITRADYLVLLVKTLGLTADFSDNFDDVKPGAYYYEAVGIARKLGIAAGSGNNRFSPLEAISRQDMMVLTARALEKYKGINVATDSAVLDRYADKRDIADYAVGSLATLVKAGLITGSGDTINPLANTTRAEAAVFLYRIYNRS